MPYIPLILVRWTATLMTSPKGAVLALGDGQDWSVNPGGTVIMLNSFFHSNFADNDNGGVVNVGRFARLTIEGDENVFEENACGLDGGVIASTTNSSVTIEGGAFKGNKCGLVSHHPGALFPVLDFFIANTYVDYAL